MCRAVTVRKGDYEGRGRGAAQPQTATRLGRQNDAREDLERLAREATRPDIREGARRALK